MFEDAVVQTPLSTFFKPVADLRGIAFQEPVPYLDSHPLPGIIRPFSTFMAAITVVIAGWTDIGESCVCSLILSVVPVCYLHFTDTGPAQMFLLLCMSPAA
jgi:hypothetical protein